MYTPSYCEYAESRPLCIYHRARLLLLTMASSCLHLNVGHALVCTWAMQARQRWGVLLVSGLTCNRHADGAPRTHATRQAIVKHAP